MWAAMGWTVLGFTIGFVIGGMLGLGAERPTPRRWGSGFPL